MANETWRVFQLADLLASMDPKTLAFQEILRTPSLSCALYHLPAGSKEMERAHEEDELYLVLEGRARLRVEDEDHRVEKGTLMYVHAACDHAFFDVEEDLTALAFFGVAVRRFA
jgi:mannose-6-phosphate isomerase-like protein (cupin superfamily)